MIVVVEGPSAVGKTTLVHHIPSSHVISEDWSALGFPPEQWPDLDTSAGQAFGVRASSYRWKLLCDVEHQFGNAYADTDPLKLYYNFALALQGTRSRAQLEMTFELCRHAMKAEQLGFADRVVFLWASAATLRSRKQQDTSRQRRRFDLHLALIDAFAHYYMLLEQVRPGTVTFYDTDQGKPTPSHLLQPPPQHPRYARYDLHTFDTLQEAVFHYLDVTKPRTIA
jgi:hypothetical protein